MSDQAKIVLTGNIFKIFDTVNLSGFSKREFLIKEEILEYPQTWRLEFHKDDVNTLDSFKEGDHVECHVNLRGFFSEKSGTAFNTFHCWRIKIISPSACANNSPNMNSTNSAQPENVPVDCSPSYSNDELPF